MIANFATVSGASVAALLAVHAVTFVIARRVGRYNVVDVAWGLGFIAIALVAAVLGDGDALRRWLLLALVAIWGLRLSWYIHRRSAGHGEIRATAGFAPARRHRRPNRGPSCSWCRASRPGSCHCRCNFRPRPAPRRGTGWPSRWSVFWYG